jgi:hypothetical protein
MFKIKGELKVVYQTHQVSDKFRKREFVLIDDFTQYPQKIIFQLIQDKCELIDLFQIGSRIEIEFRLRGREWIGNDSSIKYFNSLDVLNIKPIDNIYNTIPTENFLTDGNNLDKPPF